MELFSTLSHDPQSCANALRGAAPGTEVFVDLETTGVGRRHSIVSVGVLVNMDLYILFVGSHEVTVAPRNISVDRLRQGLAPLGERTDLVVIFHNAVFDLGHLKRAGVDVTCHVRDTLLLMLLIDPDRSRKEGVTRIERRYKQQTNYRLKDLVLHLLDVDAPHFPGAMAALDYRPHVRYLSSDLIITRELYLHLTKLLRPSDVAYYDRLVAPVTVLLAGMSHIGVQADAKFIHDECQRLLGLMRDLSAEHERRFGQRLDVGDFGLRGWVYLRRDGLRIHLPKHKWVKVGTRRLPSLKAATLAELHSQAETWRASESLAVLIDYLLARSLLRRLAAIRDKYIDPTTGRVFTKLSDVQASGRVSSTSPNLQSIAKPVQEGGKKEFISAIAKAAEVRSRNALRASDGFTLVAFDISQADIRCLAHAVDSLQLSGPTLIQQLEQERVTRLGAQLQPYLTQMWDHFRPENRKPILCPRCAHNQQLRRRPTTQQVRCGECGYEFTVDGTVPAFDPDEPSQLAEDFRLGGSDFYTTATQRMLGRPPADETERNAMKQTVLGVINGMSARGLAVRLDVDVASAQSYLDRFAAAYPKETAYIELMYHAAAITGSATTFAGRRRRVTPHYWMVSEPEIELFLSYRAADKLWVRVIPLSASRHTLTCWVKSVVDARYDSPRRDQEIYHHRDGRISHAAYRFFEDDTLIFKLPVRNISWRLIRRVRTAREEATYQGFDKTRRSLTNHIFQGGTADVVRTMMLRSQPVCGRFGAQLLLQIHDELLFEAPGTPDQVMPFVREMTAVLEQPPTTDFRVPIVVEPKLGIRFGDMHKLKRSEYSN